MTRLKRSIISGLEKFCDVYDRFVPTSNHPFAYISFKLEERWKTGVWDDRGW